MTLSPMNDGDIRPLQYGRGLAALLVCLFHYETVIPVTGNAALGGYNPAFIFRAGHSGVEFFFVLSGFIIFLAHRNDLGRPQRLGTFYQKRAIRILPIFWLTVIPSGVAVLILSSHSVLTPVKLLLDVILIPREGALTLPAAWTLQHEAVFYLLFGFMILNRKFGIAMFAAWQFACLIVLVFSLLPQDYSLISATYFGYYNFGFFFGIVIAALRERINYSIHRQVLVVLGCLGFLGLLVCFAGEWRSGSSFFSSPAISTLTYFVLYSLVILALLSIENKRRSVLDISLGSLGAASYILYIIHEPLYSALYKVYLRLGPSVAAQPIVTFILFVAIAVASSIVIYYFIERPMLRWLRRQFVRNVKQINIMTAP